MSGGVGEWHLAQVSERECGEVCTMQGVWHVEAQYSVIWAGWGRHLQGGSLEWSVRVQAGKEDGYLGELAVVAVMGDWPHIKEIELISDMLRITGSSCSLSEKGVTRFEMEKTKMSAIRLDCNWWYLCELIVCNVYNYDRINTDVNVYMRLCLQRGPGFRDTLKLMDTPINFFLHYK